ncbi:MAG: hypothetical protein L0387_05985 [Acidobacteria bacterium]|nr:hypothetical protein [Acidobacteriota bacterium]MCI0723793.1 hypothetical protein [Acidobacteriota bacterium]
MRVSPENGGQSKRQSQLEAGAARLCSICRDAYNLWSGLLAAFTRLLPNSGQPLYGWLAQSADLPAARFSGLQAASSTSIHFTWNHLRSWLKPEESPLETGLGFIIAPIDQPAVKRLAFNLETSRVNAALGQTLVPLSQIPI